jgi:hypothetical protein
MPWLEEVGCAVQKEVEKVYPKLRNQNHNHGIVLGQKAIGYRNRHRDPRNTASHHHAIGLDPWHEEEGNKT